MVARMHTSRRIGEDDPFASAVDALHRRQRWLRGVVLASLALAFARVVALQFHWLFASWMMWAGVALSTLSLVSFAGGALSFEWIAASVKRAAIATCDRPKVAADDRPAWLVVEPTELWFTASMLLGATIVQLMGVVLLLPLYYRLGLLGQFPTELFSVLLVFAGCASYRRGAKQFGAIRRAGMNVVEWMTLARLRRLGAYAEEGAGAADADTFRFRVGELVFRDGNVGVASRPGFKVAVPEVTPAELVTLLGGTPVTKPSESA